jgi:hypothetical protein
VFHQVFPPFEDRLIVLDKRIVPCRISVQMCNLSYSMDDFSAFLPIHPSRMSDHPRVPPKKTPREIPRRWCISIALRCLLLAALEHRQLTPIGLLDSTSILTSRTLARESERVHEAPSDSPTPRKPWSIDPSGAPALPSGTMHKVPFDRAFRDLLSPRFVRRMARPRIAPTKSGILGNRRNARRMAWTCTAAGRSTPP